MRVRVVFTTDDPDFITSGSVLSDEHAGELFDRLPRIGETLFIPETWAKVGWPDDPLPPRRFKIIAIDHKISLSHTASIFVTWIHDSHAKRCGLPTGSNHEDASLA